MAAISDIIDYNKHKGKVEGRRGDALYKNERRGK